VVSNRGLARGRRDHSRPGRAGILGRWKPTIRLCDAEAGAVWKRFLAACLGMRAMQRAWRGVFPLGSFSLFSCVRSVAGLFIRALQPRLQLHFWRFALAGCQAARSKGQLIKFFGSPAVPYIVRPGPMPSLTALTCSASNTALPFFFGMVRFWTRNFITHLWLAILTGDSIYHNDRR
jgi:hypothetical protein